MLGDRIQLQQVLLNLLMNAIEAMSGVSAGPRTLWVSSELAAATEVLVTVHDSGPGIDPQSLDRLFDASIRPSRAAWAWAWQSVAGLSRRTVAGCGPRPTPAQG
jgi:signal transduction histidine kinase